MRGRWAAGITPRNFSWIIKDRLAVSERPGGYAPHHRRVRRQEEILWLAGNGFDRVISLLPSPHNLHAYEERALPAVHFPLPEHTDVRDVLSELYPALLGWLRAGERLLVHHERLDERVAGVMAGFLCWSGVLPEPPRAISVVELLLKSQMGSLGRSIVAVVEDLPAAPVFEPIAASHEVEIDIAAVETSEIVEELASPEKATLPKRRTVSPRAKRAASAEKRTSSAPKRAVRAPKRAGSA